MIGRLLRIVIVWELLWAFGIALALHAFADWPWGTASAAGAGTPLGVHACLVALGFARGWSSGSPTPDRHRLGILGAARLYLGELTSSLVAFQVRMPWMETRPLPGVAAFEPCADHVHSGLHAGAPAGARPAAVPVLLIHGYLCNRQIWRPMAVFLAARGHPIDAMDLEPPFGSIDAYAPSIAAAIDRLRERTGAARVALVCHSMGGLAARAYLRSFGDDAIAHVVTLGTPHRGTVAARSGIGINAAQMRIGSDWLDALASAETEATGALFTVVLSHHDNVVMPQAGQTLHGARTVEVGGIGHVRLSDEPRVLQAVAAALQDKSGEDIERLPTDRGADSRSRSG